MNYGGQPRWDREATYEELHRWCRNKLDRQTDAVAEPARFGGVAPAGAFTGGLGFSVFAALFAGSDFAAVLAFALL